MTRLELLHLIQDNQELLTLPDAVALLAGRLHESNDYINTRRAWEQFFQVLVNANQPTTTDETP
jgi:hypothetical protein